MDKPIVDPSSVSELDAITKLIDTDANAATDAYETWVWKWQNRIIDIGGTAHLRFHNRTRARRQR